MHGRGLGVELEAFRAQGLDVLEVGQVDLDELVGLVPCCGKK